MYDPWGQVDEMPLGVRKMKDPWGQVDERPLEGQVDGIGVSSSVICINNMVWIDLTKIISTLSRAPETNMALSEIDPGSPALHACTLAKSHSNSLCCCYFRNLYNDLPLLHPR